MNLSFIFGGGIIITLAVVLFIFLFPLIALVDVLTSQFQGNDKLLWVIVILLLPFLGAFLYFIIGRDKKVR